MSRARALFSSGNRRYQLNVRKCRSPRPKTRFKPAGMRRLRTTRRPGKKEKSTPRPRFQKPEPGAPSVSRYSLETCRSVILSPTVMSTTSDPGPPAYAYVRNNPMTYTDPTGGGECVGDCWGGSGGDYGGCDPDFDPFCLFNPLYFDLLSGPAEGRQVPEYKKFPWPVLPPLFFVSSLSSSAELPGPVCDCILFFGINRGWTGCAYACTCGPTAFRANAFKKCNFMDQNADLRCPFYTEWTVGPGGVGGPGSLLYPPNFCGSSFFPPGR